MQTGLSLSTYFQKNSDKSIVSNQYKFPLLWPLLCCRKCCLVKCKFYIWFTAKYTRETPNPTCWHVEEANQQSGLCQTHLLIEIEVGMGE